MKRVITIGIFFLCMQGARAGEHDHHAHAHTGLKNGPATTNSLFQLDDKWLTDEGKELRLRDLEGSPTVIAMLYTSCTTACPLLVEDMKKIEKALPESLQGRVDFVGVTLDPKRDTVEALGKYKKAKGLGSSWKFLRGEPSSVRALAAALGVQYKKEKNGDFQHSFLVSVLNKSGVIILQQAGLGQTPEKAVAAITAAAR